MTANAYLPDSPRSKCGSWLACDDALKANIYPPETPRSNCGSWLACDGALKADTYLPDTPTIQMWELACLR